jgi:hypothetical protein
MKVQGMPFVLRTLHNRAMLLPASPNPDDPTVTFSRRCGSCGCERRAEGR